MSAETPPARSKTLPLPPKQRASIPTLACSHPAWLSSSEAVCDPETSKRYPCTRVAPAVTTFADRRARNRPAGGATSAAAGRVVCHERDGPPPPSHMTASATPARMRSSRSKYPNGGGGEGPTAGRLPDGQSRPTSWPRRSRRGSSGRFTRATAAVVRETLACFRRPCRGPTLRRKTARPGPSPAGKWMLSGSRGIARTATTSRRNLSPPGAAQITTVNDAYDEYDPCWNGDRTLPGAVAR